MAEDGEDDEDERALSPEGIPAEGTGREQQNRPGRRPRLGWEVVTPLGGVVTPLGGGLTPSHPPQLRPTS